MITALDANILIDVAGPGSPKVAAALTQYAAQGTLVVSPVVYAELSVPFRDRHGVDGLLAELNVFLSPMEREAAFAAGKLFRDYLKRGGGRTRILADFLIGGHALRQADQFLTLDRGFYREYFRGLKVIEP